LLLIATLGVAPNPQVSREVLKNGDHAVTFLFGLTNEHNVLRPIGVIIAQEIIRIKEKENAASGLIADSTGLFTAPCENKNDETNNGGRVDPGWKPDLFPSFRVHKKCAGRLPRPGRRSERRWPSATAIMDRVRCSIRAMMRTRSAGLFMDLGFEVTLLLDQDLRGMEQTVREFGRGGDGLVRASAACSNAFSIVAPTPQIPMSAS
jgi:hypothetical protein